MGTKITQRSSGQSARKVILEACRALVLEEGYDRLSIRRLTARCGYSAPTIYHHFGDKQGLTDALLQDGFDRLLLRLRRIRQRADPVDQLRDLLRTFVRFGLQNPTHYRLLAARPPTDSEPLQAADEAHALIETPLLELHRAGRLVDAEADAIIQSFWALAHGIITLQTSRLDIEWSSKLLDIALDGILFGVVRKDLIPTRCDNRSPEPSA